jgi:hypothetical protein
VESSKGSENIITPKGRPDLDYGTFLSPKPSEHNPQKEVKYEK